jgi:hypothetical protein
VHLRIEFEADAFDARFERLSDGRQMESPGAVSSVRWDGEVLVFSDRMEGPDGPMTIVFRYQLEDGGRRLRASEQFRSPKRDQDNVWVFERS